MIIVEWLLCIAVVGIVYTYVGYPVLMWLVGRWWSRPVRTSDELPTVSVVIAAHNEEMTIERKIINCLELDYPKDRIEILVGSDASEDTTDDIIQRYRSRGITWFRRSPRGGKVSVLNLLVSKARGEIVVLTDARQRIDRGAVRALVRNFADNSVGCVSGLLQLHDPRTQVFARGLRAYWDYEVFLRKAESAVYSMVGVTGALYAVRRRLYVAPPYSVILDDMYIPLHVVMQGYRTILEPAAVAYDEIAQSPQDESRRKRRTLAGNWQLYLEYAQMFNPLICPVAFQLFSHKLLRLLMPYMLMLAFVTNGLLAGDPGYRVLFIGQVAFYACALGGVYLRRACVGILAVPYVFCALNIDAIRGAYAYMTGTEHAAWEK